MDTNVLPNDLPDETNTFHPELDVAISKLDRREARAERNAGFGSTIGGMTITTNYHALVTEAVSTRLNGPRPRSNTYEFRFERFMRMLEPRVIALALLQAALHGCGTGDRATQRDVVSGIGRALNDELWAAKLLQTNKKLSRKITKAVKEKYGSVELRKKMARKMAEKGDADGNSFVMQWWSGKELSHAGNWGMNLLLEVMPDIFVLDAPHSFKGERIWRITERGTEMAKAAVRETVLRSPVYQPRTEKPKDWDTFIMRVAEDDRTLDRSRLLRTFHKDVISAAKHAIASGAMAPALKGLNTLQSVPFKLNTYIMDLIIDCYNNRVPVKGVPLMDKLPVPQRLSDSEFYAKSHEERRLITKTARGLHKFNLANDSATVLFTEDMASAARLASVDAFYTPMNWDWRTRTYALTGFNFQREDRVRAMFLFAQGKPIGEEGIRWLKIHAANCGDFDKVSKKTFGAREKWVDDNLTLIADYVNRPLENTGWTQADSPFLFLAACRELVSALNVGPAYVTHLPTSWDGACNGLQHLAAMTRAPEGRLVNLTDNAEPLDVYQVVADIAKRLIEADLDNNDLFGKADDDKPARKTVMPIKKLARMALSFGVDRKLVKRNVMTTPYSSGEFGMGEQHFEDTMVPLELEVLKKERDSHPFGDTEDEWRLVSRYLAKRVREAIREVVGLPMDAMGFMQSLAKVLAHEGKPLRWTTPAGVPCVNRYHESTTERVELFCYDKGVKVRTQITIANGYEKAVLKDKAAAGISPNVVHSMDASHLLLSVCAASDEGITDIATVHDSFGCLACDAPRFNQIIRETFLRMYEEHDILAELLESARADLTEASHHKLPALPPKGALDLKEILKARYAFA
jgi:DNA-directed RNA polymerase